MEVDSGAGKTIMSANYYKKKFKMPLQKTSVQLQSVIGPINVLGEVKVRVSLPNSQTVRKLSLVVCESSSLKIPLLGRDWLDTLFPYWRATWLTVNSFDSTYIVDELKLAYPNVFDQSDSNIREFEAHLTLKSDARPVFMKPYQLPYGMVDIVSKKIDDLVAKGKIEKVEFSKWASPCLPVRKKDGSYRLCIDVKRTLNPNLEVFIRCLGWMTFLRH